MTLKNIIRVLVFYLVFIACPSYSATYYVDYIRGADTNSGTSKYSPFKHCPGDDEAVGNADMTSLVAGDKVIFKGGVQYEGQINIKWSGASEEQRIIYDGDSGTYVPKWRTGKAIIDGKGELRFLFYFKAAVKYVTINGFILRHGSEHIPKYTVPLVYAGELIYSAKASEYIVISNNDLSDAGISNANYASGYCLRSSQGNHWEIAGNSFTDCGSMGLSVGNGSYNDIHHNIFTGHHTWAVNIANASKNDITDNYFHDNTLYDVNRYYTPGERHGNWMFVFTSGTGALNNTKIYNNKFYNSYYPTVVKSTAFVQFKVSSSAVCNGLYIYNNVMFNTDSNGLQIGVYRGYNGALSNIHIYNNTFYDINSGTPLSVGNGDWYPERLSNLYIKNNNFVNGSFLIAVPDVSNMSGIVEIDYNNYYSSRPSKIKMSTYNGLTKTHSFLTWEQWQALGYDLNGIGPQSDPLFVNTAIISNVFDLSLKSNSPCIGRGYKLGVPYDKDYKGKSRGELWDIGAYQY